MVRLSPLPYRRRCWHSRRPHPLGRWFLFLAGDNLSPKKPFRLDELLLAVPVVLLIAVEADESGRHSSSIIAANIATRTGRIFLRQPLRRLLFFMVSGLLGEANSN
mmetsp:Transcript_7279/g.16449  ORF Transcript_7279/g.16449 Transcript_7279/m.16449 type:complete len:106 (-) Transcript_7279:85-402(-)